MELKSRAAAVPSFLELLSPESRTTLQSLPRQERVAYIAEMLQNTEHDVLQGVADDHELRCVDNFKVLDNPTQALSIKIIHAYHCLPIVPPEPIADDAIAIVTVWPPDGAITEWVRTASGKIPVWYLGSAEAIAHTIIQRFGVGSAEFDDVPSSDTVDVGAAVDDENKDAAVIKFVNAIIVRALEDRATDIHFEPQKKSLQIRYRIDGELVPVSLPDNLIRFQAAIISRLKIMSRLNISEKRRPQDGRIRFVSGPVELDIRLSSLPTLYGESVSLRLLHQGNQPVSLQELGLVDTELELLNGAMRKPHGIILVTGPTGSGKSTTLSACLRKIRTPERRILTVEDPVEYEVDGVNQTQVHAEIGLTFATVLRHILRQDPDVIMIGEIRDRETADIAIRAALTGHLVLSSLHTNDAPGALTRLVDMGVEPFLIASSVELVIAQRLVRRLCANCKTPVHYEQEVLQGYLRMLGIQEANSSTLYGPKGCDLCKNIGFRGRTGIFEILRMSDAVHKLVVGNASAKTIRAHAATEGMRSLQQSGWEQVKRGLTSLESILKFAGGGEEI